MVRTMLNDLIQDFRHGARFLSRAPGFTGVAILALALGVGANAAIFAFANALFLRPLPVTDPSSLTWVTSRSPQSSRPRSLSYPDYLDYRDRNDVFNGMLAYNPMPFALSEGGQPERVQGQIVSGNYFEVLGVRAALGRVFTAEEDRTAGAAPVIVISDSFWKRRFGSDPALLLRVVTLNGQPFSIIGVMPERFTGMELGRPADIWVPFSMHQTAAPALGEILADRGASWLRVIGRLRTGITPRQARAALSVIAGQIEREYPAERRGFDIATTPLSGGLHPDSVGEAVPFIVLLLAVTAVVLLIACFNVANLLLARAAGRRREIAIRLAVGAKRGRLVRQLLAESTLLALLGGAAGLFLVVWVPDLLIGFAQLPADIAGAVVPDPRVIGFTLAVALATGFLCGLAPALGATRSDVAPALKDESGDAAIPTRHTRLQGLFVIAQVASSLVLLVCAGLFLRSLAKVASVDPEVDTATTLTFSFDTKTQGYSAEKSRLFCLDLIDRMQSLPGVRSVTLATLVPLNGRMIGMQAIPGDAVGQEEADEPRSGRVVSTNIVWPGYFRTLGIPLLRGRDFTLQDREGAPGVVIINETMAREMFAGDPLGRRLSIEGGAGPWLEIVGIAKDSRYDELIEDRRAFMYLPHLENAGLMPELALIASVDGDPAQALASVQQTAHALDPDLPLFDASTLLRIVRRRNDKQQAISKMLTLFGTLALFLASMGLYGVMAYSVGRRTREIGIRMAVGARHRDVVTLFVRDGVRLASIGVAVGGVLALILMRALSSMLFGVRPTDLLTFVVVAMLLAGVAVAASWLPARRAARVDPCNALRHQ
jgi:putative ABC transport system permease protein